MILHFVPYIYTYNAMKQLSRSMLSFYQLLKSHITVAIRGKWNGGRMGRGWNPYTCKAVA